mmetsp:Transcript_34707/g.76029  ORF Transcript_34707/g.76029 Transcript_34707/m.76029 type:complete len:221 (-) Transcript_34707:1147-1809(-)
MSRSTSSASGVSSRSTWPWSRGTSSTLFCRKKRTPGSRRLWKRGACSLSGSCSARWTFRVPRQPQRPTRRIFCTWWTQTLTWMLLGCIPRSARSSTRRWCPACSSGSYASRSRACSSGRSAASPFTCRPGPTWRFCWRRCGGRRRIGTRRRTCTTALWRWRRRTGRRRPSSMRFFWSSTPRTSVVPAARTTASKPISSTKKRRPFLSRSVRRAPTNTRSW